MKPIKSLFSSAYLYIFLASYAGVVFIWNYIKLPARDPAGIISHLTVVHYNPIDNILRFLAAILVPPMACLIYWWMNAKKESKPINRRVVSLLLCGAVLASILLALTMGMVQNSSNPANNPADNYGPHQYYLVDTFHEGETLGPAVSYQQKNLKPYTDYVFIHGVVQDPLRSVIAFKLFGRSIGAERAFTTILVMLTFILYYALLLVLFKGDLIKAAVGMAIMAFFVLPGGSFGFIQKYFVGVQFPFRDITTIVFLMSAILGFRYAAARKKIGFVVCTLIVGFIVIASYAVAVDRAIYITTLSVAWLLMVWLMDRYSLLKVTLPAYLIGLGLGMIVLLVALKGDLAGMLHYLTNISHYKDYLDGEEFVRPDFAYSGVLLALGGIIFLAGAIFTKQLGSQVKSIGNYKDSLKRLVNKYHAEILLGLTALIFMRSAIGRADIGHFIYSVQWLYLLLTYVSLNYIFSRKSELTNALKFLSILMVVFMTMSYIGQVHALNIRRDVFPTKLSDSDLVRPDYQQTANYLKQHLKGNQTFVTLTSEGIWYYLVDKPSPVQYPIIWYAFTHSQRQSLADSIANNPNIKYIITNDNWTSDFDFVPNPQRFPEIYRVLYDQYQPNTGFGQQTIWIRK